MATGLCYAFTPSSPIRAKGVLCVSVGYKGKAAGRRFWPIDGIVEPDYRFWDRKTKRFMEGTVTALTNNPVLIKAEELCEALIECPTIQSPEEFIEAFKSGVCPKAGELTLGEYLSNYIEEMRYPKDGRLPSSNYQKFVSLLHKLEREAKSKYKGKTCDLISVPISKLNNNHFIQFGAYILSLSESEGRYNYSSIMKLFKQVHNSAFEQGLTDIKFRYPYKKYAPVRPKGPKPIKQLTKKEFEAFEALDVRTIPATGRLSQEMMQLYKDYCIFIYEAKSRTCDVISAHSSDIVTIHGKKYLAYTPIKKKNYADSDVVYSPLSKKALEIIAKYKGQSSQGFIFPFAMNETPRDISQESDYKNWVIRKNGLLTGINGWLQRRVKPRIGVADDVKLTTYAFRRTAITVAGMADGANWGRIAKEAGTSIFMLEKHYVSNVII